MVTTMSLLLRCIVFYMIFMSYFAIYILLLGLSQSLHDTVYATPDQSGYNTSRIPTSPAQLDPFYTQGCEKLFSLISSVFLFH